MSFESRIDHLGNESLDYYMDHAPLKVAILGGGTAGLIRAIQSIVHNHETTVFEKRDEEDPKRENMVYLRSDVVSTLKYYGIYAHLLENNRIFPKNREGCISVKIGDLEESMKAVIRALTIKKVIHYSTMIFDTSELFKKFDLVVNTEGSKSTTNKLLGIGRDQVLPKKRAIAVFFKEDGKTTSMVFRALQSYTKYFTTLNKPAFSAVLEGPGSNYMGMMLTDADEKRLERISDPAEKDRFIKDRITLARCQTEIDMIKAGFKFDTKHLRPHWYPLKSYTIVEVGADKSEIAGKTINGVPYLIAGDALVTVDPMTGLGCNNAISTSDHFERILTRMEIDYPPEACVSLYQELSDANIRSIHQISKETRARYFKPVIVTYNASDSSSFPLGTRI